MAITACSIPPGINNYRELMLQKNVIAVVSQGDFEPQSIGSYSLRVYEVLDPKFPYDNYVTGVLGQRDGVCGGASGVAYEYREKS